MNVALAILAVFVVCLLITDVVVTRRRNDRAIENMRRDRGDLGL